MAHFANPCSVFDSERSAGIGEHLALEGHTQILGVSDDREAFGRYRHHGIELCLRRRQRHNFLLPAVALYRVSADHHDTAARAPSRADAPSPIAVSERRH